MSRVSLIIPVYNAAAFLPALMDSLLAQSDSDFQAIFSEDGSTDGTMALLRQYQERDPRVLVVTGDNSGVSAGRNRALALAEGEFIGFVDGDDVLERDYLKTLVEALEDSGADMVCCGFTRIYAASGVTDGFPGPGHSRVLTDREGMVRLLLRPDGYTTVMWNKLFRREALTGPEGQLLRFDESLHIVEDGEYILRSGVRTALFLPDRLYRYYVRTSGAMYGRLTDRKLTELDARKKIVALTEPLAPDVQDLARMKYQKGVRDLMFHAVIAGDGAKVRHLRPELRRWRRELFRSPALSWKEKLKYHAYYPLIRLELRRLGAFMMARFGGH